MGVARKAPMPEPWDRNGSLAEAFRAASANSSDARNRNFKELRRLAAKGGTAAGQLCAEMYVILCMYHMPCIMLHKFYCTRANLLLLPARPRDSPTQTTRFASSADVGMDRAVRSQKSSAARIQLSSVVLHDIASC